MTALETALSLLGRGFWPVPITPADDPAAVSPGKQPVGKGWGLKRHTPETLREAYRDNPGAGVGLKLGPEGGVVDLDVDEPAKAAPVLRRMFGEAVPATLGWSSARGFHWIFRWSDRLAKYRKAIVKNHPDYPGVEIRIGWSDEGKQYQSVVPPSVGNDGRPREWTGGPDVLDLPESFFADLDRHLGGAGPKPKAGPKPPPRGGRPPLVWDVEARAVAYLRKCDPAVSGQHGHDQAFKVACKVGPGFNLAPETAIRLIKEVYNPTCEPPWSDREVVHKVTDAYEAEPRRGWFLEGEGRALPGGADAGREPGDAPEPDAGPRETFDDPFRLAREFWLQRCGPDGFPFLRYWQEEWHLWGGTRYRAVPDSEIRASVGISIKEEFDRVSNVTGKPPAKVTRALVSNVCGNLASLALLTQEDCPGQPAWLDDAGEDLPSPSEVIPARNGLVHLPALVEGRDGLLPCTPRFFSPNCLGYDFDPDAPRPDHWLAFLSSLWDDDPESVASLQEWFGYLITPDTSQQKMLLVIGPPRSGKGTIARLLTLLVGERNVVCPTLSSFANEFRVAPLIGKTLAVFPDARLNGRSDVPVIVERLLSVSGEDSQTIDRKNRESWSGKLRTRFVLMANELPQLTDASKAITSRTVILRLTRSFLGREDRRLIGRLEAELPSILLWAVAGWARLRTRGYLTQPQSGRVLVDELEELASPVSAFLAEHCEVGRGDEFKVPTGELYGRWKKWCEENGREHCGTAASLGRWLRAAVPHIETPQNRDKGSRVRYYRGLRLTQVPVF